MSKKQFKAESKRVLDLMVNSIYTNKEIALNLGRSESSIRAKRWREKI